MRDGLIELIANADTYDKYNCELCEKGDDACCRCYAERLSDCLLANGAIVPPCKVGEEIWVIEREDGEAIDVLACMFLAQSKGCVIATSYINDYDLDETIEYHINKTQYNLDTDLMVYPAEDCYMSREEAEQALKERLNNA